MKRFWSTSIILILLSGFAYGQAPTIQWSKKYGGGMNDYCNGIIATSDGNFIAIGSTDSFSGDVVGHRGLNNNTDVWLIKIDKNSGGLVWSRCLGGLAYDSGSSIQETFDGGYILAGSSTSNSIDVSGLHGANGSTFGSSDIWVVKTDTLGQIQWQKCIGSNYEDKGIKILQTSDSGYILLGQPRGFGGDIIGSYGDDDLWIAKLNAVGDIQWSTVFGTFWPDNAYGLTILNDGSYLITGGVGGTGGNIDCSNPQKGAWVIKVDTSGNEVWQRCYGGSADEQGFDIIKSNDGGFYLASSTQSNDGDVTGLTNFYDFWIVKCDSSGSILWEKCFGASWFNQIRCILQCNDGGVIACGYAQGIYAGFPPPKDAYVVKLDSLGNLEWSQSYGGSQDDEANSIIQLADSSFVIAGSSSSIDGDITNYRGAEDFWVLKLNPPFTGVNEIDRYYSDLSGFIGESSLHVKFNSRSEESILLTVSDLLGRMVFEEKVKAHIGINEFQFPANLSKSISILQLKARSGVMSVKIF